MSAQALREYLVGCCQGGQLGMRGETRSRVGGCGTPSARWRRPDRIRAKMGVDLLIQIHSETATDVPPATVASDAGRRRRRRHYNFLRCPAPRLGNELSEIK